MPETRLTSEKDGLKVEMVVTFDKVCKKNLTGLKQ